MSLSPPTDLASLQGQRDRLAGLAGFPEGYRSIRDGGRQLQIDNALAEGLDRIALDLELKSFENEDFFTTRPKLQGTDMVVTQDLAVVTSASSTFQTDGVQPRDKIQVGVNEGWLRVLTVDSETQLTMADPYPGTSATGQSFAVVRDDFELADDAWWVKRVWDATNARPIRLVSQEQLGVDTGENFETLLSSASEPFLAMIVHPTDPAVGTAVGTVLRLYPAPDERFNIGYTYCVLPTVGQGPFRTRNHLGNVLYWAAASAYLLDDDDERRARAFDGKYERAMPKVRTRDSNRARTRVRLRRQWIIGQGRAIIARDERIIPGDP